MSSTEVSAELMAASISSTWSHSAHVARQIRFDRELERLLRERSHGEQLVLQGDELLLEVDARQRLPSSY